MSDIGAQLIDKHWRLVLGGTCALAIGVIALGFVAADHLGSAEVVNAADGVSYNSPIYAFTQGDEGDAEEEWQDRGVTPICYGKSDEHAALWDTLSAWADAVRNPEEWAGKVIGIAQKRPIEVTPHERGQSA